MSKPQRGFVHPKGIVTCPYLIPNIPLVVIDAMLVAESAKLILKRNRSVVFFLMQNVEHAREGLRHGRSVYSTEP